MKYGKKLISLLLLCAFVLLFASSCAAPEPPSATASESVQATEDLSCTAEPDPEKEFWEGDLQDVVCEDKLFVYLMPSVSCRTYTAEDFADVGCTALENELDLNIHREKNRSYVLCLAEHSGENLVAAMKTLEARPDVFLVEPICDYPLDPCNLSEAFDFADDRVSVAVQPSARYRDYTVEDFSEINCVAIEKRFIGKKLWLKLTLGDPSKENVAAAIRHLEERCDFYGIYRAQPNFYSLMDPVVTDEPTVDAVPDDGNNSDTANGS